MQYHKTSKQMNSVWRSDNTNDYDNRNGPVQLSNVSHFLDVIKLLQLISLNPFITPRYRDAEKFLSVMKVNGSLGYRYHNTSHSSSHHPNNNDKISEEEVLKFSSGEVRCVNSSLETSHSSSSNHGCCEKFGHRYIANIHSYSSNCRGCGRR